ATSCSTRCWRRVSWKQAANRSVSSIARSAAPRSSAPASEVIAPPSKAPTTSRPSTGANPNKSALHSVGIGALLESSESRCGTTTFADSASRCAYLCEISGLAPYDGSGAADQPRQLLEAAGDAVADEIDHLMLEYQHQFAALAAEMGRRQHAGPRGRDQMRDAECSAQDLGAVQHRRRHLLLDDPRRLVLLAEARIAEEHRQPDESAALVSDRAEIAVDDGFKRLLAPMVGVHPPADIGQQAGGMAQPAVFPGLAQMHDARQAIGPLDQFLGVARRARQQLVQALRGADEPVLVALALRQHREQKAFAHAEGRERDGLRPRGADDVFE